MTVKTTPKKICFVHESMSDLEKELAHKKVCQTLDSKYLCYGQYYCVLHAPDLNKVEDFTNEFQKRLDEENFIFRGVFFPSLVDLSSKIFKKKLDFRFATFTQYAIFNSTIFNEGVYFQSATFQVKVFFNSTIFKKATDFDSANFVSDVDFAYSKFLHDVYFHSTIFLKTVDFSFTVFAEDANFRSAKIGEKAQLLFHQSELNGETDFRNSEINGFIYFLGKEFMHSSYGKLIDRLHILFESDGSYLNLKNTKIHSNEGLNFQTVRLQPSWFIGINCKNIVFTDCRWEQIDNEKLDIRTELNIVDWYHKAPNSYILLSITLRQLAENAENSNRFEVSSNFRRMAFETEWLEKKEKISNWIKNLVPESEKLKRRFGGSTDEKDKLNPPTNSFGILRRSGDFIIHGLYRITSFYGESWSRAAFVLALIIFSIFPFIYTQIEFQVTPKTIPLQVVVKDCNEVAKELQPVCKIENRGLNFWSEAIPHSLATAAFQTVEYRIPKTAWGSIWIILEKIFAPLQAALLALAIRRKFMR